MHAEWMRMQVSIQLCMRHMPMITGMRVLTGIMSVAALCAHRPTIKMCENGLLHRPDLMLHDACRAHASACHIEMRMRVRTHCMPMPITCVCAYARCCANGVQTRLLQCERAGIQHRLMMCMLIMHAPHSRADDGDAGAQCSFDERMSVVVRCESTNTQC